MHNLGCALVAAAGLAAVPMTEEGSTARGAATTAFLLACTVGKARYPFSPFGQKIIPYCFQLVKWPKGVNRCRALTVGGLLVGSAPPAAVAWACPHPIVVTTLGATAGCLALGVVTGGGYESALRRYLTRKPVTGPDPLANCGKARHRIIPYGYMPIFMSIIW